MKKRKVVRKSNAKRPAGNKVSEHSSWVQALYESQTSRTIVAEMLVAAAGAAAAVLLSDRGRAGAKALAEAGGDALKGVKRAGKRTSSNVASAVGAATDRVGAATGVAAKAVGLKSLTQHDLAEKAFEIRQRGEEASAASRPETETHPRAPTRGQ